MYEGQGSQTHARPWTVHLPEMAEGQTTNKESETVTDGNAVQPEDECAGEPAELAVWTDLTDKDKKALFYLVCGRPDSLVEVYPDPICVTPADIIELDQTIRDKLDNHDVLSVVGSTEVALSGRRVIQFGSLGEFASKRWTEPQPTTHVIVRWDFMLRTRQHRLPQRHTLTVRISGPPSLSHVLQLAFSKDPDELDQIDTTISPCFARVDFISHVLSQELIERVAEWHKGRERGDTAPPWFRRIGTAGMWLAFASRHAPLASGAYVAFRLLPVLLPEHANQAAITLADLRAAVSWLGLSALAITILRLWGVRLGRSVDRASLAIGRSCTFAFTKGDEKRAEDLRARSGRSAIAYVANNTVALVLSILGSVVAWWLTSGR